MRRHVYAILHMSLWFGRFVCLQEKWKKKKDTEMERQDRKTEKDKREGRREGQTGSGIGTESGTEVSFITDIVTGVSMIKALPPTCALPFSYHGRKLKSRRVFTIQTQRGLSFPATLFYQ